MPEPQLTRSELQKRTFSLPLVESGHEISETEALAIIQDLTASHSAIPDHIKSQVLRIYGEVTEDLEELPQNPEVITLSRQQLLGALTKTAIRAAAQTVSDIGQVTNILKDFEQSIRAESSSIEFPPDELGT